MHLFSLQADPLTSTDQEETHLDPPPLSGTIRSIFSFGYGLVFDLVTSFCPVFWHSPVLFILNILSGLYKPDQQPGDRGRISGGRQKQSVVSHVTLFSHSGQLLIVPQSLGFNMVCWCGGCCWKVLQGCCLGSFPVRQWRQWFARLPPCWPDNGSAKCGTIVLRCPFGEPQALLVYESAASESVIITCCVDEVKRRLKWSVAFTLKCKENWIYYKLFNRRTLVTFKSLFRFCFNICR